MPAGILQSFEQLGEFFAWAVVVLGDGQPQRVLKYRFGFPAATERDECFAEKNVDDHPVAFLAGERVKMFERTGKVAGVDVGLREIETR